jgi:hypothetical protein
VRDATGNGSRSGTEDLSDLYAESTPTILGFDDDAVYAQTAKGGAIARWDLEDGHRSDLGDNEYPVTENRPGGPLVDSTSCTVCRARRPRRKPVQLAVGGRRFRAGRLARRKQVLRPRRRRDQALHRAGDGVFGDRVAMHRSKSSGPCRGRQPSGVHHR